jgi:hypothetical protein
MIPPSNVPVTSEPDKSSEVYQSDVNVGCGLGDALVTIAGLDRAEKTAISLPAHALMPGRNRAERRFVVHCARRILRGTLAKAKRAKLDRLARELRWDIL